MSDGAAFKSAEVRRLRRLITNRAARDSERLTVIEGAHLLVDALRAAVAVDCVYVAPEYSGDEVDEVVSRGGRRVDLQQGVMERVADAVTPQSVCATVPYLDRELDSLGGLKSFLVADQIADPGNTGTILRAAEAAGVDAVIFSGQGADVYAPKAMRASAGAVFFEPFVRAANALDVVSFMHRHQVSTYAAVAHAGENFYAVDLATNWAVFVGNEARGLDEELVQALDAAVTIPHQGRGESLNVAIAASVMCFEAMRQRHTPAVSD